ncbi:MAG TPA: metallophosphoesterase [Bryobacteraceae bacterium]|nr:metallophosphoesterase [Bryobacteraceae bacterium]HOL73149.1 metallophosphoesterase [Bryobacteraceae bacterium]HOQ45804.1 metallophosphoesterase [Bryobacteraceae bacterium]HPQ15780.1 metallophosphoesterase [Bryobacteraceae bacterium]HPU70987.1 metallophosphoesterase [Bryobacteraceae bacterium]
MKLLVFSDIHGDVASLQRLMAVEADHYVAAGDLSSWGRGLDRCGEVLRSRAGRVWVLPGNHESAEQIAEFCRKFGLNDFHGKTFEAEGYNVAGLGYSSPTPFHTPGEYSEEELARRLAPFAGLAPLILVCHCPPFGTSLDRVREGLHAGSRSVKLFIDRHQPAHFFCGHIHEAEGVQEQLGKTYCVNAGKRGYLLDLAKM